MNLFKNNHANGRFFERVHPDIACKKDIVKSIQHPENIQFIKRLTESRSMAYVHLPNDNVVKIILNKKKKEIVTILPWKDVYKVEIEVFLKTINDYVIVEFYPDCFMETANETTLNKVKYKSDYLSYNCFEFECAVYKAYLQYQERKENDEKIKA